MLEMAARGAQILAAIGGAYLLALWFVLIVWTYRDIEARSKSVVTQVFSTLLVVLFFVPGVLLYLILRPKETLDQAFQRSLEEEYLLQDLEELPRCPACHRQVQDDFVLCPHCQAQLREPCPSCSRLVDLRWSVCPYCAAPQRGQPEPLPKVEMPAARWIAPGARRRRLAEGARPELGDGQGETVARPLPDAVEAPARTASPAREGAPFVPNAVTPSRGVVRPLDRFRGRAPADVDALAAGASAAHPDDRDRGFDPRAHERPSPPDSRERASETRRDVRRALGGGLFRSMSAYEALTGRGSAPAEPGRDEPTASPNGGAASPDGQDGTTPPSPRSESGGSR